MNNIWCSASQAFRITPVKNNTATTEWGTQCKYKIEHIVQSFHDSHSGVGTEPTLDGSYNLFCQRCNRRALLISINWKVQRNSDAQGRPIWTWLWIVGLCSLYTLNHHWAILTTSTYLTIYQPCSWNVAFLKLKHDKNNYLPRPSWQKNRSSLDRSIKTLRRHPEQCFLKGNEVCRKQFRSFEKRLDGHIQCYERYWMLF